MIVYSISAIKCQPRLKSYSAFRGYKEKDLNLLNSIDLKNAVSSSISNEGNLIGEGRCKKVYNLLGMNDYAVRVFKNEFKKDDLKNSFMKPESNYVDEIDDVILSIPGKIDIVKKKNGNKIGVNDYSERIEAHKFPPLQNVYVKRHETLQALALYEKIKDFPLESYRDAYKQVQKFCKYPGFQLDIISPNNILIDEKNKKINLIDPLSPAVNDIVQGKSMDLSKYHGSDSLYPVLCDFLMHKEHLNNLTELEQQRWKKAINCIISKSIEAGQSLGCERNVDKLKILYSRISEFWQTNEISNRYDNFISLYPGTVYQSQIVDSALEIKNSSKARIDAIKNLETHDFNKLKLVFEKIIQAPHQPKVELPEILNATLDKIFEYRESAVAILPVIEKLFDKEIFYPTKKRLYDIFIELAPENPRFIKEITNSSTNIFEKVLYSEQFESLYEKSNKLGLKNNFEIKQIYQNSKSAPKVSKEIADKLWVSRSCVKAGELQDIVLKNVEQAYKYIESKENKRPEIADIINLHKILLDKIPNDELIAGKIRTPDLDYLFAKIHNIKEIPKNAIRVYPHSKDVKNELIQLETFYSQNYENMEPFALAGHLFKEIIRIHPFFNGNGRATRLFVEAFLLSKGYQLKSWAEETLYINLFTKEQIATALRKACK